MSFIRREDSTSYSSNVEKLVSMKMQNYFGSKKFYLRHVT